MIVLDLFFQLPWQPILGKISQMTFIRQAGVTKRVAIWQFRLKIFKGNIVATSNENLIKIGPVTQKIARVTTTPF